MKKLLYVLSVLVLVSCGQHKKEIAQMQAKQDSITQVAVQKNNTILEFIDEMNEIQSNLDSIKTIEKIISVEKASSVELKASAKQRIAEDIAQINDLLQKNKALVKSLTNKYKASNAKITELETTIVNMNKQLAEKDADIARLTAELEALHINVTNLNQQIETITAESAKTIKEKEKAFEEQGNAMNTAYYAFGTKKELAEKNVIEKEGGVLGMGKTLTLKKDFNRDYFKKVDIREFKQLTLNAKKAVLLANHPADSYHLTGTNKVEALVIDKPDEFWKTSKYLVIVIEN
jgi:DNA repair exonuclease SbcCD ATPase subunit